MKKIIAQQFMTLDGLAAGPKGNTDFVPASMQGDQAFEPEQMVLMDECDTLLLGA